jgi:hypothetical protein
MFDALCARTAMARSADRESFWRKNIDAGLCRLQPQLRLLKKLNAMLFDRGIDGPLLLSNQHVRDVSRAAFLNVLGGEYDTDPTAQYYLVTAGGTRGVSTLRQPVADLVSLQRAVDKAMRRVGLSGIFSFEFDIVRPLQSENDYPVLAHAHGVVRPIDRSNFKFRDVEDGFAASRGFQEWNGGVGLHITPIIRTATDIATVAVYLADPMHQLKFRYPNKLGEMKMRATRSKFPPEIILRGTELQSYVSAPDAVFGIGEIGVQWRREWWAQVRQWQLSSRGHASAVIEGRRARIWERLWSAAPQFGFEPCQIATRSSRYREAR